MSDKATVDMSAFLCRVTGRHKWGNPVRTKVSVTRICSKCGRKLKLFFGGCR